MLPGDQRTRPMFVDASSEILPILAGPEVTRTWGSGHGFYFDTAPFVFSKRIMESSLIWFASCRGVTPVASA
jgi:hypothetical protein